MIISHGSIVRGGRVIVRAATIDFPEGSCVGVVGLNGAGKSTWLHAISGLAPGAESACRIGSGVVERVAVTTQSPSLPHWLTVAEAIDLLADPAPSIDSLRSKWKLDALLTREAGRLSKGETQFVSAIITLESAVPLHCLDEPFSALDLVRRRQLIEALVQRRDTSRSVTIVTAQVASDLYECCTHILALHDGTLTMLGSVDEMSAGGGDRRAAFERRTILALVGERAEIHRHTETGS